MTRNGQNSRYMDYVEDCIKDIERRGNDMIERTLTVQADLIRLVKERHTRDRTLIEDRFRSGVHNQSTTTSPAVFRHGNNSLESIKEIFGDILLSYENEQLSLSTNSCKSFECNEIRNISLILPTKNSSAWICSDSGDFIKVHPQGYLEKSFTVDIAIEHAAAQGDEFIFTSSEVLSVKRIKENGLTKTGMSTSPLFPLGVHVTLDGDILLCLVDRYEYSITTKSRRLIMIYPQFGLITTTLEHERGHRIFTIPTRVTSLKNDVIAIDVQSKTRSRIVSLSRNSETNFEFSRQGQFSPSDICTTSNLELFVLEEATQSIFVLNKDGLLMSTIRLSDFCITQATVMAFNIVDNTLWIGHSINKISIFSVGDPTQKQAVMDNKREREEIINKTSEDTWF